MEKGEDAAEAYEVCAADALSERSTDFNGGKSCSTSGTGLTLLFDLLFDFLEADRTGSKAIAVTFSTEDARDDVGVDDGFERDCREEVEGALASVLDVIAFFFRFGFFFDCDTGCSEGLLCACCIKVGTMNAKAIAIPIWSSVVADISTMMD